MKKLYRSRTNRKIAGVCGGLAEYWGLDVTILRIIVVVLFFITAIFPVLIAYFIAILLIPLEPESKS
ncbi:MAG: hypothetical protein K940chlam1_00020 [Candidatus Anoxychlamydiales bacterium]|nr:hypothetical protein [Candidatus Anoxychlamydiales bacterium]NGX35494.1 hypothetical protein [Candidatus Anoxychlamydiales bacterium]